MYNLIIFDADGTLFDYDRAEKFALEEALKKNGFHGDFPKIRDAYRKINFKLWSDLEKGTITKARLRKERFRLLFDPFDLDYNIDQFSDLYLEKLGEAGFLLPWAEDLCQYLSRKYRLAILTNGIKEIQHARLDRSPIKAFIEEIIVSEETGTNKPDPAIFEFTFKKLKHTDKSSVLMVGDSLTSDILGACRI